jgi:hypothetical protein
MALQSSEQIADGLILLERDTLTGDYHPYGAHATVIYEHLRSLGLWDIYGRITPRGELVAAVIGEQNEKVGYKSAHT